jgi:hypothetical protein
VAWCISWGAYAEYAVVPAARLARVPDSIGYDLAAAAVFQGSTAYYLIDDVGQIKAGSTCLVHAASGGIGQVRNCKGVSGAYSSGRWSRWQGAVGVYRVFSLKVGQKKRADLPARAFVL